MSLKDQISDDMKAAMRARETERLGTIRLLLAAIKQREVDERVTLDDAGHHRRHRQDDQEAAQGLDQPVPGRPAATIWSRRKAPS